MTNSFNPILCEDPTQAQKQREIVKNKINTKGYDHATRVINLKRDGVYYNNNNSARTVKNRINIREE